MSEFGLMKNKRGLIMGLANDHSLAWGISQQLAAAGADLAFTFQNESLERRVRPLGEKLGADTFIKCDVSEPGSIESLFKALKRKWDTIDFVVHAVAFSDKNELQGRFYETSRPNFTNTMDISCFSLIETCKYAQEMMNHGGAVITLTYYGSEKVMPNYNIMGVAKAALEASVRYLAADLGNQQIRVNAISAGPVRTLASSGIGNFRDILKWNEANSPLKHNTTIEEVGGSAVYLLSDLSKGVTGEIHHVDSGYHVVGMRTVKEEVSPT